MLARKLGYALCALVLLSLSAEALARSKALGQRPKHLTGQGTLRGAQTQLDMEAAAIDGGVKQPMLSPVSGKNADKNYDFVKVRLRWHPEMVQSTTALR